MKPSGNCHICLKSGRLSCEHVPPSVAFNSRKVKVVSGASLVNRNIDLDEFKGKIQQRGFGGHTLCGRCNNLTGAWYGSDYVSWAYQSLSYLQHLKDQKPTACLFDIRPLRVLKQILCIFFSLNGTRFATKHPDLVQFVLDKEKKGLRKDIQVFAYLNSSGMARTSGIAGKLNIETSEITVMSDFAFFPLGYLMTFGSSAPNDNLFDVTTFSQYAYNDFKSLRIPLAHLPVVSHFPGDYRTKAEIQKTIEENLSKAGKSGDIYHINQRTVP